MEVRWNNVIAAALLLIAVIIFVKNPDAIGGFLSGIRNVGAGHSADESIRGLTAAGFVGVLIVAVVKILTSNNRSNDR